MERQLPADYDPAPALRFAAARAVVGLEVVGPGYLERIHRSEGHSVRVRVRFPGPRRPGSNPSTQRLVATATPGLPAKLLRSLVVRQFDLGTDLTDFRTLAAQDPILGPLVCRRPGLRIPALIDPFEAAIRAVVGQLISVAAARTVLGRLVERFGQPIPSAAAEANRSRVGSGPGWRAFPTPERLGATGPAVLRAIGITAAKATAIRTLGQASAAGALDWEAFRSAPDLADRTLRALPGIGPWTAAYIRLRGLGDRDAFLSTDLGVIHAFRALGIPDRELGPRADRWRPWRGYAVIHLWESLHP